jgi:hypothetical protein
LTDLDSPIISRQWWTNAPTLSNLNIKLIRYAPPNAPKCHPARVHRLGTEFKVGTSLSLLCALPASLHKADVFLAPVFDSWLYRCIHFLLCDVLCDDCSCRALQFHEYLGSNQEYINAESSTGAIDGRALPTDVCLFRGPSMVVYGFVHFELHHGFCSAHDLCARGSKVGNYLTPSPRLQLTDCSFFYSQQASHLC